MLDVSLLTPEMTLHYSQAIAIGAADRGGWRLTAADGRWSGQRIRRLIRHCRDRVDFSSRNATGHVWKGEPHVRIKVIQRVALASAPM